MKNRQGTMTGVNASFFQNQIADGIEVISKEIGLTADTRPETSYKNFADEFTKIIFLSM